MANVQRLHKAPARLSPAVFLQRITPGKARLTNSRLEPWYAEIILLLEEHCTLEQVRAFLAANGVAITITGISNFLQRRREKEERLTPKAPLSAVTTIAKGQVSTLGCLLSDAEICRCNGWRVGTVLVSQAKGGMSHLRITAIGETHILAREVRRGEKGTSALASRELTWALSQREWAQASRSDA